MLKSFESGTSKDVGSIITGDKTCKVWLFGDEKTPAEVETLHSTKKRYWFLINPNMFAKSHSRTQEREIKISLQRTNQRTLALFWSNLVQHRTDQILPPVILAYIFPEVKRRFEGRHFSSDNELLATWDEECEDLPEITWKTRFDDRFRRMERCIDCGGEYFLRL